MGFNVYLNLLREVSLRRPGDIGYRLWHALQKKTGLLDRRFPPQTPEFRHLLDRLGPGFTADDFMDRFDDAGFYAGIELSISPELFQPLLAEAENCAARRFSFSGSPVRHFPDEIDWHHSLEGEGSWPLSPWHSVGYRNSQLGDIKTCWEWNRHWYFPCLALAGRVTGDDRFVQAFSEQLVSWSRQNPPEMGIHYNSNLELGLRCTSWLWAHFLARNNSAYSLEARRQCHLNLYYMARHIYKNLVYTCYTGRNNHLIGDAACLALVALCCPHLRDADDWLARSLGVLWPAFQQQVLPDGMHYELSFGYHVFVLEFVLGVVLLLQRKQRAFPEFVLPTIEKMLVALLTFRLPDGGWPCLNDCDDAFVFPLSRSPQDQAATLFALGAVLFGRADFAHAAGYVVPLQAQLILGEQGLATFGALKPQLPKAGVFALESAGLVNARNHWGADADMMLFDNHRDPFPNSGHNHASSLQLLLWVEGLPVLVDSGTFRYTVETAMRNGLRGTAAHNTVCVDGRDQAIPHRDFGWISKLAPGATTVTESDDFVLVQGDHFGYRSLKDPVTHHRAVVWLRNGRAWVVCDQFLAKGVHHFSQYWHLSQSLQFRQEIDGIFRFGGDNRGEISIRLVNSQGEVERITDRGNPPPWLFESLRYGSARTKQVLRRQWTKSGPHTQWTVISADDPARVDLSEDASQLDFHLGTDIFRINAGPQVTVSSWSVHE